MGMTTTSAPGFKKGDKVTQIGNWDGKGTVYFYHAVVHSCGKKQMILISETTGKEIGRHFAPVRATLDTIAYEPYKAGTFALLTDEEAAVVSLAVAERYLAWERARLTHILAVNADKYSTDDRQNNMYRDAVQQALDALHEPRVHQDKK